MKKKVKKYSWRNYNAYMKNNPQGFWFKRKLYGWGWVPVTWQGLTITLAFIALLLLNGFYFAFNVSKNGEPTTAQLALFFGVIIISIIILFLICYKKGERPKWSWGR